MASPVDAVVDTSALVAILLRESDAVVYLDALARQCDALLLFKGGDFGLTDVSRAI